MESADEGDYAGSTGYVSCQFDASLNGFRAAVAEEEHVHGPGKDFGQGLAKPKHGFMECNAHGAVHLFFHLLACGGDYSGMIVSDIDYPECSHEVHVALTVQPVQVESLCFDNWEVWPILRESRRQHLLAPSHELCKRTLLGLLGALFVDYNASTQRSSHVR